jgi:hypothetical protein
MSWTWPFPHAQVDHYRGPVGGVRFACAGVLAVLMTVVACDGGDATASRFCEVARSERMRSLGHLDLTDADAVADASSLLSLLRAAAPTNIRHDLTRLIEGVDDPVTATSQAALDGDSGDLQAAAHRVDRYLHDTCGVDR